MITEKRELKNVPIADLIPYARNPRKNDPAVQRVAASLKEYGLVKNSIVVDEEMVLITGHTTMKAMQALGWTEAPEVTQVFGLTEAQKKAYRIADNKLGELATWDEELLALEFEDLKGLDFDLDLTGFDDKELGKILDAGKEASEDDYEPPVEIETSIQRGDLFRLGRHRLLCGDSTRAEDVGRLMEGKKADLLLTDPPYGVSYVGKTKDALTIENDALTEVGLEELIRGAFSLAETHCRPGAYWYATVPARPLHLLFADDWKARGILRQILVWVKDSLVLGHSEYHYQHEPILFGWMPGERYENPDRTRTTVWECPRPKASREHPTMKPVALWARAIQDGSREADLVFDPFLGSGTTLVACEQLGRTCYGMEISPQYCQVIIDRWEKLTGQKVEKVDGD
jgi:DNA modification methylase